MINKTEHTLSSDESKQDLLNSGGWIIALVESHRIITGNNSDF